MRRNADARHRQECFILPRPEYDCFVVELPPMPQSAIPTALRYQVRSRYPGDPAATVIDSVANGPDPRSRLVLALSRERLEGFRALAAGRTLIAPTLLLASFASGSASGVAAGASGGGAGGGCSALFWAAAWAELARFRGGALVRSVSVRREEAIEKVVSALITESGSSSGQRLFCVLSDDCTQEGAVLTAALAASAACDPEIILLSSLAKGSSRRAARPFVDRTGKRARSTALLRVCLALALLSALMSMQIYASRLEGAIERAKREAASARALDASSLATKAQLDQLEARYAALEKAAEPDPYAFTADIVGKLGRRSRVRSLRLDGKQFQLEAQGADALGVLARFEADRRFVSVKLHEAVPSPDGGERFSLSGSLAP